MPQMAPMNWLMLFMFTIIMLFCLNSLNYFLVTMTPNQLNNKIKQHSSLYWKW